MIFGKAPFMRFFDAINSGDQAVVVELLKADPALVQARDPRSFGATAIGTAVSRDNYEMIDLLLSKGADINAASDWKPGPFTPLMIMKWETQDKMGPFLLERGAHYGMHGAARLGDVKRLRELLAENPARLQERGGDGQFPLHFAGTPEVVDFLLDAGADIEGYDLDHQSTAAEWCVPTRKPVLRRLVERGAKPDIFMAATLGDTGLIDRLANGDPASIERPIPEYSGRPAPPAANMIYVYILGSGARPLHIAVAAEEPASVKKLVELGADINAGGGYDNATSLHWAAWRNQPAIAVLLLDLGADITRLSGPQHHNDPLAWAIVAGWPDVVEKLLQRGAIVSENHLHEAEEGVLGNFGWATNSTADDRRKVKELVLDARKS